MQAELADGQIIFKEDAMIDTGANINICSAKLIKDHGIIDKNHGGQIITVDKDNPMDPIGVVRATVKTGSIIFHDILFQVVDNDKAPLIIGQDLWRHSTVRSWSFNNEAGILSLVRDVDGSEVAQETTFPISMVNKADGCELNRAPSGEKLSKLQELNKLGLVIEHGNADYVNAFVELAYEYKEIWDELDESVLFPHEVTIKTMGSPIAKKQHPIPVKHRDSVDAEVDKMLKDGVIEKCEDGKGWRSPILTVDKPDGSIRVCLNFKNTLNRRLVDEEVYSQAPADDLFARISHGNDFMAAMDMKKGYWQLPLSEECRHVTCFQWRNELYQFKRLPFGLKTAGSIFCRAVSNALNEADFDMENTFQYLDDISVMAKTFDQYMASLRKVFHALKINNLRLSAKKCKFLTPCIKFLGRYVSRDKIEPDPEYIEGLDEMKPPRNKRQLQSLIGTLCWLRSFVGSKMGGRVGLESFSHLMAPIFDVNRMVKFHWTTDASNAFERIKKKLGERPFLSFYEPGLPLVLTTDASDYAAGAVLMQKRADDDYIVIGCVSRTFAKTERKWSCTEKEAYAIRWAVEKFRYFLAGQFFTIMTDHKALTYIDSTDFANQKVQRWQEYLSSYNFICEYIEGQNNCFADWLSRGSAEPEEKRSKSKDLKPAGKFAKVTKGENSMDTLIRLYIPSWTVNFDENEDYKLTLTVEPQVNYAKANILNPWNEEDNRLLSACAFMARHTISDDYELFRHLDLVDKQRQDPFYSKIIESLQFMSKTGEVDPDNVIKAMDERDHRFIQVKKMASGLFLDIATGLLCHRSDTGAKLIVPDSMVPRYLHEAHDNLAHAGIDRVGNYLAAFYWPNKAFDIERYVKSCESCARVNGTYGQRPVRAGINEKGTYPGEIIYIDYVSMPPSHGFKCIMTLVDSFSRFLVCYPLRSSSAKDTASCIVDYVARFRTVPRVISSDRGTHFAGQLFQDVCAGLGTASKLHVAWRPTSSGILERQHRKLKQALYITSKERNVPWNMCLQLVVSAMNASFNAATKCVPFECIYGHPGKIGLPDLSRLMAEKASDHGLLLNGNLRAIHDYVRLANAAVDQAYLNKTNDKQLRRPLEVGDRCALFRPLATDATKKENWIGEYTVLDAKDCVTKVKNIKNDNVEWVSNHHLRRLDERPEHLTVDDEKWRNEHELTLLNPMDETREVKPVTPPVESKGGEPVHEAAVDSTSSPPSSTPITPAASSSEPRRGRRQRVATEHMNIASTKGKTYIAMGPKTCPSYRDILVMGP